MGTSWKTLLPSDYFKKEDVKQNLLLTVKSVAREDNPFEQGTQHVVMSFRESHLPDGSPTKKLIMKPALYSAMEEISGTDEIEGWPGRQVVLFFDPSVQYMGKRVGGVRLRAPRQRPPQQAAPPPQYTPPPAQQAPAYEDWPESAPDPDDDIPF
jgi:hypothetical protein